MLGAHRAMLCTATLWVHCLLALPSRPAAPVAQPARARGGGAQHSPLAASPLAAGAEP